VEVIDYSNAPINVSAQTKAYPDPSHELRGAMDAAEHPVPHNGVEHPNHAQPGHAEDPRIGELDANVIEG
jgi:hypothetical protein